MAPSQSQPVKSLNKGSGRRRFVVSSQAAQKPYFSFSFSCCFQQPDLNLLLSIHVYHLIHVLLLFVVQFKTFAQRVEEIDINVYRSLDTTKPEPTAASSFFLESLLQWRVRIKRTLIGKKITTFGLVFMKLDCSIHATVNNIGSVFKQRFVQRFTYANMKILGSNPVADIYIIN